MSAKIIGVVSGKGGAGKTVTAINLSLALHNLGHVVTLLDADVTAPNIGLQLGIYSFPATLQDVMRGSGSIRHAIYAHPLGLKIIPSSISLENIELDTSHLKEALSELDGTVIIDSPPGLGKDAMSVLDACDEIIVVSNPEMQAVANALKVIRVALGMQKPVIGLVVNRCEKERYNLTPSEITSMCDTPILSEIPDDRDVKMSVFQKTPVISYNPYSCAAIEFQKLACAITGVKYEQPKNLALKRLSVKLKRMLG